MLTWLTPEPASVAVHSKVTGSTDVTTSGNGAILAEGGVVSINVEA